MIKTGRVVIDPTGRHVRVLSVDREKGTATVRLGGSYGATVDYPLSTLTPVPL